MNTTRSYFSFTLLLLSSLFVTTACSDDGTAEPSSAVVSSSSEVKKETHNHDHAAHATTAVSTKNIDGLYKELASPQPTSTADKIEVVEIFWYGCPHCYQFEPYIHKWLGEKADYIEFVRMPGVLGPQWLPHARAYYAVEKLGMVDKIHLPLFDALHKEKKKIMDPGQLRDFFATLGVDKSEFEAAYNSKEVEEKVRHAFTMGKNYQLTGVPAVVINGKYLTSATIAGSFDKAIDVINTLSAKEHQK